MILLILFLPVSVYLIWVGGISRHSRPAVIGGSWDFIALLFAGSGLIFVGFPAVITSVHESWRRYWLTGDGVMPLASLEGSRWFWIFVWMAYFFMVLILSFILIYRRRCWTCFYNVEAGVFDSILVNALEQSGFSYKKFGDLYVLVNPINGIEERMEIEVFPFFNHAAIYFNNPAGTFSRGMVESISQSLIQIQTPHHWGGLALMFLGFFMLFLTVIGQLATSLIAR